MTSRIVQQQIQDQQKHIESIKINLSQQYGKINQGSKMNIYIKEKFCWLPQKCDISGNQLFLKKYYKLTRRIDGPGSPVFVCKRVSSKHYLVLQLSNNVESVFKNGF